MRILKTTEFVNLFSGNMTILICSITKTQNSQDTKPTRDRAMLMEVNFLLKLTRESLLPQPMFSREKVKKVTVGRIMREGCL